MKLHTKAIGYIYNQTWQMLILGHYQVLFESSYFSFFIVNRDNFSEFWHVSTGYLLVNSSLVNKFYLFFLPFGVLFVSTAQLSQLQSQRHLNFAHVCWGMNCSKRNNANGKSTDADV